MLVLPVATIIPPFLGPGNPCFVGGAYQILKIQAFRFVPSDCEIWPVNGDLVEVYLGAERLKIGESDLSP